MHRRRARSPSLREGLGEGDPGASTQLLSRSPDTIGVSDSPDNPRIVAYSRELRANATNAEGRLLWSFLRNRQLGGLKFRRQHPFGPYVADFFCREARIVIELDGDHHGGDLERRNDARRTAYFRARGIRVLRFDVLCSTEEVLTVIWRHVTTEKPD